MTKNIFATRHVPIQRRCRIQGDPSAKTPAPGPGSADPGYPQHGPQSSPPAEGPTCLVPVTIRLREYICRNAEPGEVVISR